MLNYRTIIRIWGVILITEGIFMWLAIPVSLIFGENDFIQILLSGAITLGAGLLAYLPVRKSDLQLNRRDGTRRPHSVQTV